MKAKLQKMELDMWNDYAVAHNNNVPEKQLIIIDMDGLRFAMY